MISTVFSGFSASLLRLNQWTIHCCYYCTGSDQWQCCHLQTKGVLLRCSYLCSEIRRVGREQTLWLVLVLIVLVWKNPSSTYCCRSDRWRATIWFWHLSLWFRMWTKFINFQVYCINFSLRELDGVPAGPLWCPSNASPTVSQRISWPQAAGL